MKISEPGIYDMPEDIYHADPAPDPSLSSTLARLIVNRSPRHAWTASPRLNPDFQPVNKETFDIGRACHAIMLGKGASIEVVDADDWRSKAAQQQRNEARAAGYTPLLRHQYEATQEMVGAASRQIEPFGLTFPLGPTEVVAAAQIDGVWCRAMIDYAPDDVLQPLYDVKTCDDASPEACIRAVTGYGYDLQAAFYLDVWHAATLQKRGFRFVFIEKAPPYGVSVIELHRGDDDADWMTAAHDKAAEARRIWGECLRTGRWPGYPAQVAVVGAPVWHVQRWEDRRAAGKPSAQTLSRAAAWQAPHGDAA